jgi:hypothetical protein
MIMAKNMSDTIFPPSTPISKVPYLSARIPLHNPLSSVGLSMNSYHFLPSSACHRVLLILVCYDKVKTLLSVPARLRRSDWRALLFFSPGDLSTSRQDAGTGPSCFSTLPAFSGYAVICFRIIAARLTRQTMSSLCAAPLLSRLDFCFARWRHPILIVFFHLEWIMGDPGSRFPLC